MSGMLGYDPDALPLLRTAIGTLNDALGAVRSDDPAAQAPLAPVAGWRTDLDGWDRQITAILGVGLFMPPPTMAPDDLIDAVLCRLASTGWVVRQELIVLERPDLSGAPAVMTVAEATAIGQALTPAQLSRLLTDDSGRAWLLQRLAVIDADPALRDAFTKALADPVATLNELAALVNERLQHPVLTSVPNGCGIDTAETDLERMIGFIACAASGGHVQDLLSDPNLGLMAGAFVVRTSDLRGTDLADAAVTVLRRAQAESFDGRWASDLDGPIVPGDLILPIVANDPVGCRAFTRIALDNTDLLLGSTSDAASVQRILLSATDRGVVPAAEAGDVISAMLRAGHADDPAWHPSNGHHVDLRPILGDVIAPWLDHFTAAAADDWSWGDLRAELALRWLLGDPTSATAIMNRVHDMIARGPDGAMGWPDLGDLLTRVLVQARAAHVDSQLGGRALIDLAISLTGAVLSMLPGGKANVASIVAPSLLNWAAALASSHGWLPATDAMVITQGWIDLDAQLALTVALAVGAAVHQLVAAGELSGDREDELTALIDHAVHQPCPSTTTAAGLRKFATKIDSELSSTPGGCTTFTAMVAGLLPETSGELACAPHDD